MEQPENRYLEDVVVLEGEEKRLSTFDLDAEFGAEASATMKRYVKQKGRMDNPAYVFSSKVLFNTEAQTLSNNRRELMKGEIQSYLSTETLERAAVRDEIGWVTILDLSRLPRYRALFGEEVWTAEKRHMAGEVLKKFLTQEGPLSNGDAADAIAYYRILLENLPITNSQCQELRENLKKDIREELTRDDDAGLDRAVHMAMAYCILKAQTLSFSRKGLELHFTEPVFQKNDAPLPETRNF